MIKRCQTLLGTFVEIKTNQQENFVHQAIDEAFLEIKKIHDLMSFFSEKSEVAKLNSLAFQGPVLVSSQLFEVLEFAQNLAKISDGIFDITLHRSAKNCSFQDIELENSKVKFAKDLKIDLGGIAKGYAVDQAALILENKGVTDYIINAGGDLKVGKIAQKISIRDPQNPQKMICEVEICKGALATSSGYFSYEEISDRKVFPIFQKNSSALEYNGQSASIFAKSCMTADALTKILLILKENSTEILSKFNAKAALILPQNEIIFINK